MIEIGGMEISGQGALGPAPGSPQFGLRADALGRPWHHVERGFIRVRSPDYVGRLCGGCHLISRPRTSAAVPCSCDRRPGGRYGSLAPLCPLGRSSFGHPLALFPQPQATWRTCPSGRCSSSLRTPPRFAEPRRVVVARGLHAEPAPPFTVPLHQTSPFHTHPRLRTDHP